MNRELENKLVDTYPAIYQALSPRFSGSCLFECDDGWYAIIDRLSCRLEAQARKSLLLVLEVKEARRPAFPRARQRDRRSGCLARLGGEPESMQVRALRRSGQAARPYGWPRPHALSDMRRDDALFAGIALRLIQCATPRQNTVCNPTRATVWLAELDAPFGSSTPLTCAFAPLFARW